MPRCYRKGVAKGFDTTIFEGDRLRELPYGQLICRVLADSKSSVEKIDTMGKVLGLDYVIPKDEMGPGVHGVDMDGVVEEVDIVCLKVFLREVAGEEILREKEMMLHLGHVLGQDVQDFIFRTSFQDSFFD